ncbi:MAG: putative acetyltransferase [Galactobacter sp.]
MADFFDSVPLGTRVVVRYRLSNPGATAGPGLSDALGELIAVESVHGSRRVTILTRRGEVSIPTASITHAKPVPPRRPDRERSGRTADRKET